MDTASFVKVRIVVVRN